MTTITERGTYPVGADGVALPVEPVISHPEWQPTAATRSLAATAMRWAIMQPLEWPAKYTRDGSMVVLYVLRVVVTRVRRKPTSSMLAPRLVFAAGPQHRPAFHEGLLLEYPARENVPWGHTTTKPFESAMRRHPVYGHGEDAQAPYPCKSTTKGTRDVALAAAAATNVYQQRERPACVTHVSVAPWLVRKVLGHWDIVRELQQALELRRVTAGGFSYYLLYKRGRRPSPTHLLDIAWSTTDAQGMLLKLTQM